MLEDKLEIMIKIIKKSISTLEIYLNLDKILRNYKQIYLKEEIIFLHNSNIFAKSYLEFILPINNYLNIKNLMPFNFLNDNKIEINNK